MRTGDYLGGPSSCSYGPTDFPNPLHLFRISIKILELIMDLDSLHIQCSRLRLNYNNDNNINDIGSYMSCHLI